MSLFRGHHLIHAVLVGLAVLHHARWASAQSACVATDPDVQAVVLIAAKIRLGDPNGRLQSWQLGTDHCKWRGVRRGPLAVDFAVIQRIGQDKCNYRLST
jgi:hypothetical protein